MSDQVERWLKQAWHDLDAAERNTRVGLPDIALLLCQQALEKALKALYIARTGALPPRTHSIERLADLTGMRSRLLPTLLELEDFYSGLRYPDFSGPLPYELVSAEDADQGVRLTRQALIVIQHEAEIPSGSEDD